MLSPLIEEFVHHLRCDRRLSPATVDSWRPIARSFVNWCIADADESGEPDYTPTIADLNPIVIKRYFRYLQEQRGLRPRTIKAHRCALHQLWEYLKHEGHIPSDASDPFVGLKLPKLDQAERALVSDEEGWACMDACERIARPKPRALARAIFALYAYAALRRSELIALDLPDINYNDQSVTVRHGKGDKRRVLYPAPELFSALREWEKLRPRPCDHQALFAWDRSRRLHVDNMMQILEDIAAIAGCTGSNIKPHSLRHWCATRIYESARPDGTHYTLEDIRVFLGHENIETTAIYLHSNERRMKRLASLGSRHPETGQVVRPESSSIQASPPQPSAIVKRESRRFQVERVRPQG